MDFISQPFNWIPAGTSLEVEFVERIRDERKFSSLEELKLALKSDEEKTRELLSA